MFFICYMAHVYILQQAFLGNHRDKFQEGHCQQTTFGFSHMVASMLIFGKLVTCINFDFIAKRS